jgi:Ser/Thr protein kinase RdoA (MazF antagonist)
VFHRGRVGLIDFDDFGHGHRLYDLAVALWELRDEPDHPAYRDALLSGYREHRDVDVTHLDDFIAVRQVVFDLWSLDVLDLGPPARRVSRRRRRDSSPPCRGA